MFNLNGSDISGAQIEGGIILHPDVKEASLVPVKLSANESIPPALPSTYTDVRVYPNLGPVKRNRPPTDSS